MTFFWKLLTVLQCTLVSIQLSRSSARKSGCPPLNRKRLAGPVLDKKYEDTQDSVNSLLKQQHICVQLATDGWKRKNANEAQKILNFIVNFPDGGSQFLSAYNTEGASMDNKIAFDSLEKKYHWLINLVCQAHGFSLLIKDMLRSLYLWVVLLIPQSRSPTLRATTLGFGAYCMRSRRRCMGASVRFNDCGSGRHQVWNQGLSLPECHALC